jgi:hypothetical protein
MDYYTRNQARRAAMQKRADRIETIKTIATVVAVLPVLWAITVMAFCL